MLDSELQYLFCSVFILIEMKYAFIIRILGKRAYTIKRERRAQRAKKKKMKQKINMKIQKNCVVQDRLIHCHAMQNRCHFFNQENLESRQHDKNKNNRSGDGF